MNKLNYKNKNIIFFGGKRPRESSLDYKAFKYLLEKHLKKEIKIIAVYEDDQFNDASLSVGQLASEYGIKRIFDIDNFLKLSIDMGFSVCNRIIIPDNIIKHVRNGIVNLHLAPLPKYRGRHCCLHAIRNNEKEFGATLHFIDKYIDKGEIIKVRKFAISKSMNSSQLLKLTSEEAFELFIEVVPLLLAGKYKAANKKINNKNSRYYSLEFLKKINREVNINWSNKKILKYCKIFSYLPPYIKIEGKKIYLVEDGRLVKGSVELEKEVEESN